MNRQLLEQLIYFEKYGTLTDVANKLLITQPTVTRGMQKLEDELGVELFKRSVNKLNDHGQIDPRIKLDILSFHNEAADYITRSAPQEIRKNQVILKVFDRF